MQHPTNKFLAAIREGRPQVGLWLSLCSNYAAEAVSYSGFDWALVDMEHSPNEVPVVLSQLQALATGTATPVVRPAWNEQVIIKRLLDIGAPGLMLPMVQNAEEARQAVRSTRYPPDGIRGFALNVRGNAFGRVKDYYARAGDETAVLVQVETREALANVEEIASVDGVDGVFFGPGDIAADIGHLGNPGAAEVWDLIMPAAEKCRAAGTAVGTLVGGAARAHELFAAGFSFVAVGADVGLMARGADALAAEVRKGLA